MAERGTCDAVVGGGDGGGCCSVTLLGALPPPQLTRLAHSKTAPKPPQMALCIRLPSESRRAFRFWQVRQSCPIEASRGRSDAKMEAGSGFSFAENCLSGITGRRE